MSVPVRAAPASAMRDARRDGVELPERSNTLANTLEKVGVAASGGVLAHELAGPLQQLLS